MAKFGTPQTRLQDPDFKAAAHVTQGVVDTSGARRTQATTGLIQDVGELGVQAMEGYALANAEKDQEAEIKNYMDSKNNPAIAQGALNDIEKLQGLNKAMWDSPGVEFNDIDAIERAHNTSLDKYKRAVEQGVMSPDEFVSRSLDATRQAVNKNPGLYDKIIGHTQKVLSLSGIQGIVKEDAAAQADARKAQHEASKRLDDAAFALGIPLNDPLKENKVREYKDKMARFDIFTKSDAYTDIQRKAIINNPQMLTELFSGAQTSLSVVGNSLANRTDIDAVQKQQLLQEQFAKKKGELLASFGSNAGDKVIQDNMKLLEDQKDLYIGVLSGKLKLEEVENRNKIITAAAAYNIGAPEAAALIPFVGALSPLLQQEFESKGYFSKIKGVFNGEGIVGFDWNKPQTPEILMRFSGEALKQAETNPTNLVKVLESFHKTMFDGDVSGETKQKVGSTFVASMAAKGANEQLNKIAPEARKQLLNDTKLYLSGLATEIKTRKTFKDNTPVVWPKDMGLVHLGDSLVFSSKLDRNMEARFNSLWGKEINNTLQTMANLSGHGDVNKMLEDKESGLPQAFSTLSGGSGQVAHGKIRQAPAASTTEEEATSKSGKPMIKRNGVWEYK